MTDPAEPGAPEPAPGVAGAPPDGGGQSRTARAAAELARAVGGDLKVVAHRGTMRLAELRDRLAAIRFEKLRQGIAKPDFSRIAAAAPRLRAGARHLSGGVGNLSRRGKWIAGALVALVLVVGGLTAVLAWALRDLPPGTLLAGSAEPSVILEAADGAPLVQKGPFKGADASLSEFPAHLQDAVLSIEDRRFYRHWGIDPRGIMRAMARNASAGEVVEGGSTIPQQLVKILHLERDRTFRRKLREASLAIWLDFRLSKEEILTRYLNNVYLGAGATGMPAAARTYFDKDVGELTLAESALLAGLIKAPSQLNPLNDLPAAQERAALVLDAMVANEKIAAADAALAKAEPAALDPSAVASHSGTWFADWAGKEAAEIAGAFRGTMRVRTTLVPALQAAAEQVVTAALADAGAAKGASQAALVAMRPDGAVVAMVGGRSYADSEFNRAVDAKRQPGSTFKLFVFYAALRNGLDLDDRVEDAPLEIDGWEPENFGRYHGRVTLAEAFARSLNTATVRLALDVGLAEVVAAARDLGIDAPLAETPSLALGASEVSLLDLTGAYASVRAGAAPVEPWGIAAFGTDEGTRPFALGPPVKPERPLGPYHEPLVALLQLVVERGTGQAAALDGFAAGKTGTSQNYKDAWFVGFNEALVVGVWVGNDDGTPMDEVTGGKLPARIWRDFMLAAAPDAGRPAAAGEAQLDEAAGQTPETLDAEAPAEQRCNVRACSRFYRSFRSSDCTYQPYRGRRRLCER